MRRDYYGRFLHYYTCDNGWEFASRKKVPYIAGNKDPDAVVIIPIMESRGPTKIVTIKEFRPPIGDYTYGFPAGLIDEGESPEEAAIRELKEETGLDTIRVLHVTPQIFSSEGLTDESVVVVYLLVNGTTSTEFLDENESIETELITRDQAQVLLSEDLKIGKVAYFTLLDFVNSNLAWVLAK